MKPAWLELPERSTLFWVRTIIWIALRIGRPVARVLLYPITAYFLLFSDITRRESRRFLTLALGRPATVWDSFRHYHTFARTLLDRVFVFAGRDQELDIRVTGLDELERHIKSGHGCLLVGAHIGSFEIVRAVGRMRGGIRVRALMHGDSTPRITSLYRKLNPALFDDLLFVGNPSALLGLKEHIGRGSVVALLGDRTMGGEKRVSCRFFGEPAWFPQAPALLTRILETPLVMFACLNRGEGRYDVSFETLVEPEQINKPGERANFVNTTMQRYAARLESFSRAAPYNWFNFYDFWRDDD